MHLNVQLTRNIEIGAVRVENQDSLEVITTDGGKEVRNLRAEDEARQWEFSMPTVNLNDSTTDYDALRRMWTDTERGLHTFNFYDFVDEELVKVRFASPLQITAPAPDLRHIDTITLKEVLGE
jgi:hypothetical protein